MVSTPDFTDAERKLSRARRHIKEAEARITALLNTDLYRLWTKADEGKGRVEFGFQSLHQPDKELNAVIGDAIGNLRSSLDYAVVALVYPITNRTDQTGCPFANDAAGYAGQVHAYNKLGPCDVQVQDRVINEVQAYKGGKGETLWAVNQLRNIDKHRMLVTTIETASVVASWRDGNGNVFTNCGGGGAAGQNHSIISAPIGHVEFTKQPSQTFEVRLREPGIVESREVLDFLHAAASSAEDFIKTLKKGI